MIRVFNQFGPTKTFRTVKALKVGDVFQTNRHGKLPWSAWFIARSKPVFKSPTKGMSKRWCIMEADPYASSDTTISESGIIGPYENKSRLQQYRKSVSLFVRAFFGDLQSNKEKLEGARILMLRHYGKIK